MITESGIELKIEDYEPPTTDSKDFAVVKREVLLSLLDEILARKGDSDWSRDVARKIHFGLVHGKGHVSDLIDQAKDEENAEIATLVERIPVADRNPALVRNEVVDKIRSRRKAPKLPSGETK